MTPVFTGSVDSRVVCTEPKSENAWYYMVLPDTIRLLVVCKPILKLFTCSRIGLVAISSRRGAPAKSACVDIAMLLCVRVCACVHIPDSKQKFNLIVVVSTSISGRSHVRKHLQRINDCLAANNVSVCTHCFVNNYLTFSRYFTLRSQNI